MLLFSLKCCYVYKYIFFKELQLFNLLNIILIKVDKSVVFVDNKNQQIINIIFQIYPAPFGDNKTRKK